MRIIHAVAVAGALVVGAAAAQAQTADWSYGQTQSPASTTYSYVYGEVGVPSTAFTPRASATDTYEVIHESRAAAVGAPPSPPAPPVQPR
jgi:hypothetical protein